MKDKLPTKKQVKQVTKKGVDKASKLAVNPITYKVLAGGIVAYLLYKVVSGVGKKISDSITGENINDSVGNTGGSTSKATISKQEANNYAQQLLDAMNVDRNSWFFAGTDEDSISRVFDKIKNSDDFIMIYNSFGKKDYNGYNSPLEDSWTNWIDSYSKRDLVYWLKEELSESDGEVYTKVKRIINGSGFTF